MSRQRRKHRNNEQYKLLGSKERQNIYTTDTIKVPTTISKYSKYPQLLLLDLPAGAEPYPAVQQCCHLVLGAAR